VITMPCVIAALLSNPIGPSDGLASEPIARGYELVAQGLYYYRCLRDFGGGRATPSQVDCLLGEPPSGCCLGSYNSWRYPLLGLEFLCTEGKGAGEEGTIVAVRRMPPMVPPGASDAEGKDIRALQGFWELDSVEVGGKKEKPPRSGNLCLVIEGDHLVICDGGVAVGFCYKLQRSENRTAISLSLPDPDENAQLQKGVGVLELAPYILYAFDGDKLRIAWGKAEHLKDGFGSKNITVMTLTHFRPKDNRK